MDFYRDNILDHYKNPRNYGHLKTSTAKADAANATCGDHIQMEVRVEPKTHVVSEVAFSGVGCAISQASASMLTERIKGKKIAEVMSLKTNDIEKMLGVALTPSRIKCATLPLEVLQKAVLTEKK